MQKYNFKNKKSLKEETEEETSGIDSVDDDRVEEKAMEESLNQYTPVCYEYSLPEDITDKYYNTRFSPEK